MGRQVRLLFLASIIMTLCANTLVSSNDNCECYPNMQKQTCDCEYKGLTHIPDDIDKEVQVLKLMGNNITSLEDKSVDFVKLDDLDLSENGLKTIEPTAFEGLAELVMLDLSYNKLQEVAPDIFKSNKKLTSLFLQHNPLLVLPQGTPFLVSASLETIDLGYCNVESLPEGMFLGLPSLWQITLEGNRLRSVDVTVLSSLGQLGIVDLSGNPWACDNCTSLRQLRGLTTERTLSIDYPLCSEPEHFTGMELVDSCAEPLSLRFEVKSAGGQEEVEESYGFTSLFVGFLVGAVIVGALIAGVITVKNRRDRARTYEKPTPPLLDEEMIYRPLSKQISKV